MGMTMVLRGGGAVIWSKSKDEFPYVTGMVPIFVSWIASPLSAGIVVLILFGFIRTFILRSEHSFDRAFWVCISMCTHLFQTQFPEFVLSHQLLPVFAFLTFFVITVFIIQTGNNNKSWDKVSDVKAVWISLIIGFVLGVLILVVVMPILRGWVLAEEEEREK